MNFLNRTPGIGQQPMPGFQQTYYNPYCNVGSLPMGNIPNYSQRLSQNQFVNQMTANPMIGNTYESWKAQHNVHPRDPQEEEYYMNFYNTTVLPEIRKQTFEQRRANFYNNTVYGNRPFSPYAYQNMYLYGYDETRDAYTYNQTLSRVIPPLRNVCGLPQTEILKQQEEKRKFNIFLQKKLTVTSMRHSGCQEKDIDKKLTDIDKCMTPQLFNPYFNMRSNIQRPVPIKPKGLTIELKLRHNGEVVKSFGVISVKPEIKDLTPQEIYMRQAESLSWQTAVPVRPVAVMSKRVYDWFDNNIKKYQNLGLLDFMNNHGGNVVAEALRSEFVNKYKNSFYNYNQSSYMNAINNQANYSSKRQSFYASMPYTETTLIKNIAIEPKKPQQVDLPFVDYLNFLDNATPISTEEYQRYLSLCGNERQAKSLTVYKAFHPDFDVDEYIKSGRRDDSSIMEFDRCVKLYNAMLERRPELRKGQIV